MYFRNIDTWNTGWIEDNSGGSAKRYATTPTLPSISYGQMYLGLNFPFLPNLKTPFIGETRKKHDHLPKILIFDASCPHKLFVYFELLATFAWLIELFQVLIVLNLDPIPLPRQP